MTGTLNKVALYDLRRRQEILEYELHHLHDAVGYRLPKKTNTTFGSALSLLRRIQTSTKELLTQLAADICEREQFERWWETNTERRGASSDAGHAVEAFFIVWRSKMMTKASVIAERLGELHDRVGQLLERTNQDHPNPVLRRRAEQGQSDKFLCEHIKWAHRDLTNFVKQLGANYPYEQVPATFYSWQYETSSMQHSFVSYENHEQWTRWAIGLDKPKKEPKKFSSIALSYWMPERLVSHPIIGHELAHQVLEDLYGKNSPYPRLEHQKDQLSRTLRRMIRCAEGWCAHREGYQSNPARIWALVREIMCDLLAAERYGCAYLYAWVLEIGEIDELANFMHDMFGMLRPNRPDQITPEFIQEEIFTPSRILANTIRPDVYYRGKVLVRFLRAHKRETDVLSLELLDEVDNWLERYLDLATGVLSAETDGTESAYVREFESQFGRDLSQIVAEEFSRATSLGIADALRRESKFVKGAQEHWKCSNEIPKDFSLGTQVMTNVLRKKYVGMIESLRPGTLRSDGDQARVRTFQDAIWRVEWAIESSSVGDRKSPSFLNKLRTLNFMAIDDYLYRTGNPYRLLHALSIKLPSNKDNDSDQSNPETGIVAASLYIKEMTEQGNSREIDVLTKMYRPRWLDAVDRAIRERKHVEFELSPKVPFSIAAADIAWLAPIKLREEEYNTVGMDDGLHVFHLISTVPAVFRGAEEQIREKYGGLTISSLLLGRYDAVAIGEMPETERIGQPKFSGVSRLKRLIRVGQSDQPLPQRIVGAIMVSVFFDASRIMFALWLKQWINKYGFDACNIFLSDGWEDAVVIIGYPRTSSVPQEIELLLRLVADLNKSPLVAGTETLLVPDLLKEKTRLSYRFVCGRGLDGLHPTMNVIEMEIKKLRIDRDKWRIANVAGSKDFQVTVSDNEVAYDSYCALHKAAESGHFRVETRVSWETAPEPGDEGESSEV